MEPPHSPPATRNRLRGCATTKMTLRPRVTTSRNHIDSSADSSRSHKVTSAGQLTSKTLRAFNEPITDAEVPHRNGGQGLSNSELSCWPDDLTTKAFDTMSITSGISVTSDWSRTSYTSAEFDASDDEIISINSMVSSREGSLAGGPCIGGTCNSSKRKRAECGCTSEDEEVESLFQDVSDDELDEVPDNISEKAFKPGFTYHSVYHQFS